MLQPYTPYRAFHYSVLKATWDAKFHELASWYKRVKSFGLNIYDYKAQVVR